MSLLGKFRDFQRGREVLGILHHHGFGNLLRQMGLSPLFSLPFFFNKPSSSLSLGERLKHLFEELGPIYIKFGQILSTRMDLFSPEVIDELSSLQDSVLYVDYKKIEPELIAEFGRPLDEIFLEIDPKPLAAASIAQVHKGVLRSGEKVVIKVRRPDIERTTKRDLSLLKKFIAHLSQSSFFRGYNLQGIFREFSRSLQGELDLLMEARYMVRFSQNLAVYPWIQIPQVFFEYSTKKVLVMEHLKGTKVTAFQGSPKKCKQLAQRGAQAIFHQVFIDGLFHGDPHPGNIFILQNGKIGFVDFGMIGRLDSTMKENIYSLMKGVIGRDSERLTETFLRICHHQGSEDSLAGIRRDLMDILESFYGLPVKYVRLDQAISQLFQLARLHKLYIPSEYTLITKTLLTMEKIAFSLDPDFHLIDALRDFLDREVLSAKAKFGMKRLKKTLSHVGRTLEELPDQIKGVLKKLDQGNIGIEFKHQGLERLDYQLERASKRITAGLVLCALIIGSALIITSPHRGEYSILGYDALGLLGFFTAGAIGFWMALAAYR